MVHRFFGSRQSNKSLCLEKSTKRCPWNRMPTWPLFLHPSTLLTASSIDLAAKTRQHPRGVACGRHAAIACCVGSVSIWKIRRRQNGQRLESLRTRCAQGSQSKCPQLRSCARGRASVKVSKQISHSACSTACCLATDTIPYCRSRALPCKLYDARSRL